MKQAKYEMYKSKMKILDLKAKHNLAVGNATGDIDTLNRAGDCIDELERVSDDFLREYE